MSVTTYECERCGSIGTNGNRAPGERFESHYLGAKGSVELCADCTREVAAFARRRIGASPPPKLPERDVDAEVAAARKSGRDEGYREGLGISQAEREDLVRQNLELDARAKSAERDRKALIYERDNDRAATREVVDDMRDAVIAIIPIARRADRSIDEDDMIDVVEEFVRDDPRDHAHRLDLGPYPRGLALLGT